MSNERAVVYCPGAPWDAVVGTDRHLATALSRIRPVIWMDPPTSLISRLRTGGPKVDGVSAVAPGITRLHPLAPSWGVSYSRTHNCGTLGLHPRAFILAQVRPRGRSRPCLFHRASFGTLAEGQRTPIYFATDDFVAGADLLGISARHATHARRRNLAAADSVLAVTENLAERLRACHDRVRVFPNGCNPQIYGDYPRSGLWQPFTYRIQSLAS